MTSPPPLGSQAGSQLAILGRGAVADPAAVAREAVALLNAEGGEIWIGLTTERGTVVGLEPIAGAEGERTRVQDFLVDSIEPFPTPSEIEVSVVAVAPAEGSLLCVRCHPAQPLYAYLERSGRWFLRRTGDRSRLLSREEIERGLVRRGLAREPQVASAEATLQAEVQAQSVSEWHVRGGFWLHLEPSGLQRLDLEALRESDYLLEPAATGNRRAGATFVPAALYGKGPALAGDDLGRCLAMGEESFHLRIYDNGRVVFRAPLESFVARPDPRHPAPRELSSDDLLEYPISVFRLVGRLFGESGLWQGGLAPAGVVLAHLAFFQLEGWGLRPRSRRATGDFLFRRQPLKIFAGKDFLLDRPLRFRMEEILRRPDACGFRLIRQLYLAFGFSLTELPPEFDPRLGRLILPG
jgi:schlafen family protein